MNTQPKNQYKIYSLPLKTDWTVHLTFAVGLDEFYVNLVNSGSDVIANGIDRYIQSGQATSMQSIPTLRQPCIMYCQRLNRYVRGQVIGFGDQARVGCQSLLISVRCVDYGCKHTCSFHAIYDLPESPTCLLCSRPSCAVGCRLRLEGQAISSDSVDSGKFFRMLESRNIFSIMVVKHIIPNWLYLVDVWCMEENGRKINALIEYQRLHNQTARDQVSNPEQSAERSSYMGLGPHLSLGAFPPTPAATQEQAARFSSITSAGYAVVGTGCDTGAVRRRSSIAESSIRSSPITSGYAEIGTRCDTAVVRKRSSVAESSIRSSSITSDYAVVGTRCNTAVVRKRSSVAESSIRSSSITSDYAVVGTRCNTAVVRRRSSVAESSIRFRIRCLKVGTQAQSVVTNVDDPDSFHVQLSGLQDELMNLTDTLSDYYNHRTGLDDISQPSLDQICVTKNKHGLYCRARIHEIISSQSAVVELVDYGIHLRRLVGELSYLPLCFAATELFSVHCCLAGVSRGSGTWHGVDCNIFRTLVEGREFRMNVRKVDSNGKCSVMLLHDSTNQCINASFAAEAKCHLVGSTTCEPTTGRPSINGSRLAPALTSAGGAYHPWAVEFGEFFQCQLSCSYVTGRFYVQLIKNADSLLKQQAELCETYSNASEGLCFPDVSAFEVGMPCVARYSVDGNWYRSIITKLDPCTIQYVDYGNEEVVDRFALRVLLKRFAEHPTHALCCQMAHIKPINNAGIWSKDALECMDAYFTKTIRIEFICKKGTDWQVNFSCDEMTSFAEYLIDKGLAEWQVPTEVIPEEHCADMRGFKEKCIAVDTMMDVSIAHIENPSDFYVHCLKDVKTAGAMTRALRRYCQVMVPSLDPGRLDPAFLKDNPVPCVANCPDDQLWYRGLAIGPVQDESGHYEVFFVDYGSRWTIHKNNIKRIINVDILCATPRLAINCSLARTYPPYGLNEWSPDDIALFQRLCCCVRKCHFQVRYSCGDGKWEVSLKNGDNSRNRISWRLRQLSLTVNVGTS